MERFLYNKNDDIRKRAECFFNQISDGLFTNLYVINPKAIPIIQFPIDITLENALLLSKFWSLENDEWMEKVSLLEIKDIKKQKNNSRYFQSSVVLSNDSNGSIYLIYLFLNSQKYEKVDNLDFLEQIIFSFFTFYLKEIQFGNNFSDEESAKYLIYNEAATNYLSKIAESITGERNNLFYRNLLSLSTQNYESSETKGKILIGEKQGKNNLYFEESVNISENLRMARKLIQLSNDEKEDNKGNRTFLICDSQNILGIHYKEGNKYDENYFIYFTSYNSFCLMKGEHKKLLEVKGGMPGFPYRENKFDSQLEENLKSINSSLTNDKIEKLKKIVKSIVKFQKHGAVIVIEDNAEEEAKRLSNISIKIKDPELINTNGKNINKYETFSEIDGAILMDFNACCYSFGVILDGEHLITEGHKERGSRYNSSKRYLEQNKLIRHSKTLVIVLSEDGGFDILK